MMVLEKPKETVDKTDQLATIKNLLTISSEARQLGIRFDSEGKNEMARCKYIEFADTNMTLGEFYGKVEPEVRKTVGLLHGEFFADAALGYARAGEFEKARDAIATAKEKFEKETSPWIGETEELALRADTLKNTLEEIMRNSNDKADALKNARAAVDEYSIY